MSSYMILVTVVLPVCLLYVHWCGAVAGDTVESSVQLQCGYNGARVTLSQSRVNLSHYSWPCLVGGYGDGDVTADATAWGDSSGSGIPPRHDLCMCTASNDVDNKQWQLDFRYDACGTHTSNNVPGQVTFTNVIFTELLLPQSQGTHDFSSGGYPLDANTSSTQRIVVRGEARFLRIDLQCDFPADFHLNPALRIDENFTRHITVTGKGEFEIRSGFLRNGDWLTSESNDRDQSPVQFDISSPVSYAMALFTSATLLLVPVQCWLSTGNDYFAYPRAYIIRDMCPVTSDVLVSKTVWRNSTKSSNDDNIVASRFFSFTYQAFAFQGHHDGVYYLHCAVHVCTNLNTSSCSADCRSHRRKRHAVGENMLPPPDVHAAVGENMSPPPDVHRLHVSSPPFTLQHVDRPVNETVVTLNCRSLVEVLLLLTILACAVGMMLYLILKVIQASVKHRQVEAGVCSYSLVEKMDWK